MNIYQKIAAVMSDVQYLAKDDSVDAGKGKSYRAITEEKVTSTVRAAMQKHGLVVYPASMRTDVSSETVTTQYGDKINRVTHIDVVYRMVNVDDASEHIEIASSGTGVDTQDKGVGKAMTYAYKYMLLRTFAIPTGEDPDKIASDVYTEKLYSSATQAKQDRQTKQSKADPNDTPEARDQVRQIIYGLAGGDISRVVAFSERMYPDIAFEDLPLDKLHTLKVQIAKKVEADKQGAA